ncbi:MAG: dockerin type I repeat-containing protein, partial [Prevotella sp.]|nr:dockerin type I repeat-containing protein [Prevotella sp.]
IDTEGFYSSYDKSLSSTSATSHDFVFNIYTLDGSKNKTMGLGNIVITGELTENINPIMGDVNGDGLVNITDVVCLVNYVLDSDASNINLEISDINGDGIINITDVVSLVNLILVEHE